MGMEEFDQERERAGRMGSAVEQLVRGEGEVSVCV